MADDKVPTPTEDVAVVVEGAFDPSKVDVNNVDVLASLTEAQLDEVGKYQAAHPTKATEVPDPDAKDELVVAATEPEGKTPTPAAETGEKVETGPAPVPDPAAPEKKYAGKYKTTDDLTKGVSEAAKVLGLSPDVFNPMIESAKASENYEAVEETYKRLDAEIGKKASQPAAAPPQGAPAPTVSGVTDADDPKVAEAATIAAFNQIVAGDVGREIAERGFVVPKTQAEFVQLTTDSPYHAMLFRTTFSELFQRNLNYGREYAKASQGVVAHNAQTLDSGISQVKEFATKHGHTITDDEAKAIRDAVAQDVGSYEDRYGVKYLRPDSVLSHFQTKRLPTLIESLVQSARVEGAKEALKKLEEGGRKAIRSISTVPTSPSTIVRGKEKKVDLNDVDQLASLTDEELERIK